MKQNLLTPFLNLFQENLVNLVRHEFEPKCNDDDYFKLSEALEHRDVFRILEFVEGGQHLIGANALEFLRQLELFSPDFDCSLGYLQCSPDVA